MIIAIFYHGTVVRKRKMGDGFEKFTPKYCFVMTTMQKPPLCSSTFSLIRWIKSPDCCVLTVKPLFLSRYFVDKDVRGSHTHWFPAFFLLITFKYNCYKRNVVRLSIAITFVETIKTRISQLVKNCLKSNVFHERSRKYNKR